MRDSDGTFAAPEDVPDVACRGCDAPTVIVRLWESRCGGYEDHQFTCRTCGHVWWVDGIDS